MCNMVQQTEDSEVAEGEGEEVSRKTVWPDHEAWGGALETKSVSGFAKVCQSMFGQLHSI